MGDLLDDAVYRTGQEYPELPVLQVVVTRFNMILRAFEKAAYLAEAADKARWLAARMPIFEEICLPSVLSQSRIPDLWLVGFDLMREQDVAPVLEMIRPYPWIVPVWQKTQEGRPDNFAKCFKRTILKYIGPTNSWVLTTRLDNDDALNRTYCAAARDYAAAAHQFSPEVEDFWISFPIGMQFANGICRLMPQPANAFLSRCVRVGPTASADWSTVLSGNHRQVFGIGKVYLPITKSPMWLQTVHDSNLLNTENKSLSIFADSEAELARFGVRLAPRLRAQQSSVSKSGAMTPGRQEGSNLAAKVPRASRRTLGTNALQRTIQVIRDEVPISGYKGALRAVRERFVRSNTGNKLLERWASVNGRKSASPLKTYETALPAGYPANGVRIQLSVPKFPWSAMTRFSEHVMDETGHATDTVLAGSIGGFGISLDLGKSWKYVRIEGRKGYRVVNLKWIKESEFLALVEAPEFETHQQRSVAVLVVNDQGQVLAKSDVGDQPWHGCRAVDLSNGTLMYAEYPYEAPDSKMQPRSGSRVFRSRDYGRSWQVVMSRNDIRHFHFLQARTGVPGEWWLSSGDKPMESRVWVSKDDGDSWTDVTQPFGNSVDIDGVLYPRTLFRLTDLVWNGDEVIWGTDDFLGSVKNGLPGARVFRSLCGPDLNPRVVGRGKWQIRNVVDVGDFLIIITQGGIRADASKDDKMPGVFLMPKQEVDTGPGLFHLFDAESHSDIRTAFTYSMTSRAAKNGTFFSYRSSTDVFPRGHQILKWDVSFF